MGTARPQLLTPLSCWGTTLPFPSLPKVCWPGLFSRRLSSSRRHSVAVKPGSASLRGLVTLHGASTLLHERPSDGHSFQV